jgi:hypothetical protein
LDPPPQRFKLFAALLVLCALIAYIPAISAGFIWDDDFLLTANPQMQGAHGLREIWLRKNSCDYTPVTLTTFWLEKTLWDDTPTGYHVVNILLHALAAVLLWRILLILRIPGSWLAALLFVIHPVNVASVAWIAERKNMLSAALFFASILAFLASHSRDSTRLYLSSITLFSLAGLSKEAVVTMPIVLCGCILWMNRRITRRDLVRVTPFLLIALVISFLTIPYQSRAGDYGLLSSNLPFRFARAGAVMWLYLRGIVFPIALSPMLPQWQPNLRSPFVYLPALLVVVMLGLFFWTRKSWGEAVLFRIRLLSLDAATSSWFYMDGIAAGNAVRRLVAISCRSGNICRHRRRLCHGFKCRLKRHKTSFACSGLRRPGAAARPDMAAKCNLSVHGNLLSCGTRRESARMDFTK